MIFFPRNFWLFPHVELGGWGGGAAHLDKFNEGDEETPGMRPVHNQPLQQNPEHQKYEKPLKRLSHENGQDKLDVYKARHLKITKTYFYVFNDLQHTELQFNSGGTVSAAPIGEESRTFCEF